LSRILITGGTGFLGSWILKAIDNPPFCDWFDFDTIRLFIRDPKKAKNLRSNNFKYEFTKGDLKIPASIIRACENVDAVIHVASLFNSSSSWSEFEKVNIEGVKMLIHALEPETRFVLTSSIAVYGLLPKKHEKIREDYEPKRFPNNYSRSKKLQEELAMDLCKEKKIFLISVRPPVIIGPREDSVVPMTIESILNRQFRFIGGGKGVRPIAHPWDVAKAHLQALKHIEKYNGEAFHMTSFHTTMKDLITATCQELNVEPIQRNISYRIAYFFGLINETLLRRSDISRATVRSHRTSYELDLENIMQKLHFNPEYDLNSTVKETVEWYRTKNAE
jgi:nucleoside-diphosphate-sugar epimerase